MSESLVVVVPGRPPNLAAKCVWCGASFVVVRPGQRACGQSHARLATMREGKLAAAAAPAPMRQFDPMRRPTSLYSWPKRVRASGILVATVIPGDPSSKQRPRAAITGGGMRIYTPKDTVAAEALIRSAVRIGNRSLVVDEDAAFEVRLSFHAATMQRRDVDNMVKLVFDACTGVVWKDDAQVLELHARVARSDPEPRTEMVIVSLGSGLIRQEMPCLVCQRPFRVYPSGARVRMYCSSACAAIAKRQHPRVACAVCGAPSRSSKGTEQPTCSRRCYETVHFATATCGWCQVEFKCAKSRIQKFCSSECRRLATNAARRGRLYGKCEVCGGGTSRREYTRCALHQRSRSHTLVQLGANSD